MKKLFYFFILNVIIFPAQALACPMCKEAIAKMGQIWTGIGFNLSIYLMIAVPFLLVGSFIFAFYLNYKKHNPKC